MASSQNMQKKEPQNRIIIPQRIQKCILSTKGNKIK